VGWRSRLLAAARAGHRRQQFGSNFVSYFSRQTFQAILRQADAQRIQRGSDGLARLLRGSEASLFLNALDKIIERHRDLAPAYLTCTCA
jgi:hypothetical protein